MVPGSRAPAAPLYLGLEQIKLDNGRFPLRNMMSVRVDNPPATSYRLMRTCQSDMYGYEDNNKLCSTAGKNDVVARYVIPPPHLSCKRA
jgi:hypothetical protein